MPEPPAYVLDTNVLVHYARASKVGQAIEAHFQFLARPASFRPLVSVVSVGEIRSLAAQWTWGPAKLQKLDDFLQKIVQLGIDADQTLRACADIDTHCVRNGLALDDNDTWIAAVTRAAGACLITTDKDFDPLSPRWLRRVYVDPKTLAFVE